MSYLQIRCWLHALWMLQRILIGSPRDSVRRLAEERWTQLDAELREELDKL